DQTNAVGGRFISLCDVADQLETIVADSHGRLGQYGDRVFAGLEKRPVHVGAKLVSLSVGVDHTGVGMPGTPVHAAVVFTYRLGGRYLRATGTDHAGPIPSAIGLLIHAP